MIYGIISGVIAYTGTIDSITPKTVTGIRNALNTSMMDIMYYTSPFYRYEVGKLLLQCCLGKVLDLPFPLPSYPSVQFMLHPFILPSSIHPSILVFSIPFLFIHSSIHPTTHLRTHPPIHASIRPSVCPSIHLFTHPSIHPFFNPSISIVPFIHPTMYPFFLPSILFTYPSLRVSIRPFNTRLFIVCRLSTVYETR